MKFLQRSTGFIAIELIATIVVVIIFLFSICRGVLVEENVAIRAAETQGYSNAKVIDHAWFFVRLRGCDSHDAARFTIQATNPVGKDIECYVCTGWIFKGATIRTQ
ncbi:MAG: hypothetical protein KAR24_03020 [Candidatus Pacebacteria bacterium]|nr:hypothetical protein [Candidatus Paceibacterota bacterium]